MTASAFVRPVLISGLGLITPIGNDRASVLHALHTGQHGLTEVNWGPNCPISLRGAPPGFDIEAVNCASWTWELPYTFSRDVLRGMPPHGVYALCAIEQALSDAGLDRASLQDGRTGLFCASAGSPRLLHHHLRILQDSGMRRSYPLGVISSIAGTLNFNLAAHYGIRGPVTGFSSACAASAQAIGYAVDEIRLGRQDRMIVVGAEEPLAESLVPFMGMRALSQTTDPRLASCPFDRRRSGFVGAGGAVAIILEAADVARPSTRPTVQIGGWGQSADGHSIAQSEPEGRGVEQAMVNALRDADLAASDIDYISAHATSTPIGDAAEAKALLRILGQARPPVSSTKGLTGHPLSMSGAMEAAFCTLALQEGLVPGNAHLEEPDDACGDLNLPRSSSATPIKSALSTSSGFGGSNVALVFMQSASNEGPA